MNFAGYAPAQLNFGVALRPTPELTLAFDLTHKRYEGFKTFIEKKPDPPFENSLAYRVGGEWRVPTDVSLGPVGSLDRVDLRLGYYLEETPNPSLDRAFNILDSDQHVISAGLGLQTFFFHAANVRLDLVFQTHLFEDRSTENEGDPRRGPYTMSGEVWTYGADVQVDW